MSENQNTRTSTTRFDDWNEVVDCNNCARYWDSSCDAVNVEEKRTCTSFLATRSVVIPGQINALKDLLKGLIIAQVITWAVIAILVVIGIG